MTVTDKDTRLAAKITADVELPKVSKKAKQLYTHLKYVEGEAKNGNLVNAIKEFPGLVNAYRQTYQRVPYSPILFRAIGTYIAKGHQQPEFDEFLMGILMPQLWFTFTRKYIADVTTTKKTVFDAIVAIKDVNFKYQLLWQALSRHTFLGALFYAQCGIFAPSIMRGTLYKIAMELQKLVMDKNPDLKIDENSLKVLRGDSELRMMLDDNFSALGFILKSNKFNIEVFNKQNPFTLFSVNNPENYDRWGRYMPPQKHNHGFLADDEVPAERQRKYSAHF
jgi:hypothetical protein